MNLPSREQCERWDHSQVALFMGKNMSDGDMSRFSSLHRQHLQKIAQDIQKNDDSYLNKLKRLKSKAVPEVPVRDYKDEVMVDPEDLSEMEYDNDTYDNALQGHNINYEPPPCCKVFTRTTSSPFLTGDYLDSCHNGPNLEHRKAFKRVKKYQQLPPEPTYVDSNDGDYINPDGSNEDGNYVEPADNLPANLYEVPEKEDTMLRQVSANRVKMRRSRCTDQQAESDSRIWDHENKQAPPYPPKPLPRASLKPPLRLAQDVKQRDCDQQTDSDTVENGATDQDKDADVYAKPWFAGKCDRKTADQLLFHANKDGAFMVRKSSGQDKHQPYTLVVYNKSRVYNIPIRFIHTRQQYALGREKKGEEYFHSISHIIENHQKNPLVLIDGKSNSKDAAKLRFPTKQPTTSGHQGQTFDAFSPRF
ncbi:B-cell linker protein isoform X2 [Phycodurus eques]|uniref:B-cell linker protein isoform X2 n=1 Tax=Phycodurus eques TaxID=693459 RepID=UPI002ACD8529|nr:B-cell linker protein isoform X2 [Phycodurus eques]